MDALTKIFSLIIFVIFCNPAWSAVRPLFTEGPESFKIVEAKSGGHPTFRILKDSLTKQSLAMAVNSALKFSEGQSQMKPYVELRLQKITLRPNKSGGTVQIFLQVSGKEFALEPTLRKTELLSGKTIFVKIPTQADEVAMFTLTSTGSFNLRYSATDNLLYIDKAQARLDIESPMSNEDPELIQFSGKGVRL